MAKRASSICMHISDEHLKAFVESSTTNSPRGELFSFQPLFPLDPGISVQLSSCAMFSITNFS